MRIILDNGAYSLRNMGDVAMLQIAITRLRSMLPKPELMILTTGPEFLARYCPGTAPLEVAARDCLYGSDRSSRSDWDETWSDIKRRWRSVPAQGRGFAEAFDSADAVFLCGGGFLNDINPYQTRPVLRMFADAAHREKRTGLFSQGLGPLDSPELLRLMRRTCAAGTPVALRECIYGPRIMERALAKPAQYAVTGDDAVEMAWARGAATDAKAIGFSVRQVAYSGIEDRHLETLASSLKHLAKFLSTEIVSVPISFNTHERDQEIISQLVGSADHSQPMDDPVRLIEIVAGCRMLVTGTYHAAVFALALGIPCLCFYVSEYYRNKMEGLARQFPGGCEVLDLKSPDARDQLFHCATRVWELSGSPIRSELRKAAEDQVQAGRRFYESVTGSATRL